MMGKHLFDTFIGGRMIGKGRKLWHIRHIGMDHRQVPA